MTLAIQDLVPRLAERRPRMRLVVDPPEPAERISERALQPVPVQHALRNSALDGIRGLAVLMILLFHFTENGLHNNVSPALVSISKWGWAGVDMFFVLSGFLITGILVQARNKPHYFLNFYARRSLRIFPAYYALLVLTLVLLPALSTTLAATLRGNSFGPQWTYWTYLTNFYFAAQAHGGGTLGHAWSLAIEEQFYLVWPAMVLLLRRRTLVRVCVGMFFGALALRLLLMGAGVSIQTIYFLTFTRMDSLSLGALMALVVRTHGGKQTVRRWSRLAAVAAPAAFIAVYCVKKRWPIFGVPLEEASKFTWLSVMFASLIGLCVTATAHAWHNRLLSISPLTFLGRYSYGIYLFHPPMLLLLDGRLPRSHSLLNIIFCYTVFTVGSIGLALFSWQLMEMHLLKLKRFFTEPMHIAASS